MIIYDMLICALSWGIFYGAFQNGIGGAGGILHMSEDWWYKFRAGTHKGQQQHGGETGKQGIWHIWTILLATTSNQKIEANQP